MSVRRGITGKNGRILKRLMYRRSKLGRRRSSVVVIVVVDRRAGESWGGFGPFELLFGFVKPLLLVSKAKSFIKENTME